MIVSCWSCGGPVAWVTGCDPTCPLRGYLLVSVTKEGNKTCTKSNMQIKWSALATRTGSSQLRNIRCESRNIHFIGISSFSHLESSIHQMRQQHYSLCHQNWIHVILYSYKKINHFDLSDGCNIAPDGYKNSEHKKPSVLLIKQEYRL